MKIKCAITGNPQIVPDDLFEKIYAPRTQLLRQHFKAHKKEYQSGYTFILQGFTITVNEISEKQNPELKFVFGNCTY
jgi:hypothetical protein